MKELRGRYRWKKSLSLVGSQKEKKEKAKEIKGRGKTNFEPPAITLKGSLRESPPLHALIRARLPIDDRQQLETAPTVKEGLTAGGVSAGRRLSVVAYWLVSGGACKPISGAMSCFGGPAAGI